MYIPFLLFLTFNSRYHGLNHGIKEDPILNLIQNVCCLSLSFVLLILLIFHVIRLSKGFFTDRSKGTGSFVDHFC